MMLQADLHLRVMRRCWIYEFSCSLRCTSAADVMLVHLMEKFSGTVEGEWEWMRNSLRVSVDNCCEPGRGAGA
jgi:hypothetical protein